MSWRDRLPRRDSEDQANVSGTGTEAVGTIGTNGSKMFPTPVRHQGATGDRRSDDASASKTIRSPIADSVESAVRAETLYPASDASDATSAESANRAGIHAASWGDDHDERAAIVEHDGGIPRAWAEGFARLHPDRPPAGVPLRRWQQFVDDVGDFLDSPFQAVAAALGWGPHDLFGCDRDRPFARIDQSGLLWLLNGDRLVMLTENGATIEMRTGKRHRWGCKPVEPGRVLAWELADGKP
jgi:hypothetical protein